MEKNDQKMKATTANTAIKSIPCFLDIAALLAIYYL